MDIFNCLSKTKKLELITIDDDDDDDDADAPQLDAVFGENQNNEKW